ncbi:hypothetical protein [Riemerella anatipestifer]|uniref:Uncharacterized protein n=1 Tax=Riemerella anatipestifer RA-CH-1 TaxID=1228997 RepID=J9QSJ7_RIEAN|nr:hypothetical protein [Riemerella anatipestifer]AFR34716.1 hypothetical protein B739_0108 [Riemerella anatipestifer RA-CH-1]MCU7582538.1 hypothetical protein [Riemerella anatipestifer]
MSSQKSPLRKVFSYFLSWFVIAFTLSSLSSCETLKIAYKTSQKYPVTVHLKNEKTLEGYAALPQKRNKFKLHHQETGRVQSFSPKEVDYLEFYYANKRKGVISEEPNFLHSVSTKENGGEYWMVKMCEGPNLRAFIRGDNYILEQDKINLVNIGNNYSVNSFSVYLQKKGDYAHFIGLHKGVANEDSSLRRGMVKYLSDDEKLSDNILDSRLAFDDICDVVNDYNTGKIRYTKRVQDSTTRRFQDDIEASVLASVALESGIQNGTPKSAFIEFKAPMFSSRFLYWGISVGAGFANSVDEKKLPLYFDNVPESIDDYVVKNKLSAMVGGMVGFQIPIKLNNKKALVPSLDYDLKTYGFTTVIHGPRLGLAYRIPHKYGSSFVIYGGAKYNMPIFPEDSYGHVYQYTWTDFLSKREYSIKFGNYISASLDFGYTF